MITTRNRREELLRALRSTWEQTVDLEVIVLDDASTDGTAEAVREAFPRTRVIRSEERRGLIALRNLGAREAQAPYFTSFDDDSEFLSPHTLGIALAAFDHPRVGVVAIPTVDIGRELVVANRAPDDVRRYVSDLYHGAAALMAKQPFDAIGGHREVLLHRGEDSDYARRLLQAGFVVRLCQAPEVHHHVSSIRDVASDVHGQVRAQLLHTVWTLPWSMLPRRTALSVGYAVRAGYPRGAVTGLSAGAHDAFKTRALRDPLTPPLARMLATMERQRLRHAYATTLDDLEPLLSPLPAWAQPSAKVRGLDPSG